MKRVVIAFAALLLAGCLPDASHKDALLVTGRPEDAPRRVIELRDRIHSDLLGMTQNWSGADGSKAAEKGVAFAAVAFVEPRERVILLGYPFDRAVAEKSWENGAVTVGYSEETAGSAVSATVVVYVIAAKEGKTEMVSWPTWYLLKDGEWRNQGAYALNQTWEKYPFGSEPTTQPATMPATRESAEP